MYKKIIYHDIAPHVKLHMIPTEKFKTVLMGIYIKRPLRKEEATLNALLSRVIDKDCERFTTRHEMQLALDEMYGSILVTDIHKLGKDQMLQIKLQVPSEKHIKEDQLMKKAVLMLNEIINRPFIRRNAFDEALVEREKKDLKHKIKAHLKDKTHYVFEKCLKMMYGDSPLIISEYGDLEELESITAQQLYEHYKKKVIHSPMDIVIFGNIDPLKMSHLFDHYFETHFLDWQRHEILWTESKIMLNNKVIEYKEVNQSRIALGFALERHMDQRKWVMHQLLSIILGYGGSSKLFKKLREEKGVSYQVFTQMERLPARLLVYAGVKSGEEERTLSWINEEIQKISSGQLTIEDLESAKKKFIQSLKAMEDHPNAFMNFYYYQYTVGEFSNFKEILIILDSISLSDLINVTIMLKRMYVFMLKNKQDTLIE